MANQTSLALENAKLYEEVLNMKNYNEEILKSMVSGLLTVDVQGKITTFNSMAEKLTGFSAIDVIGKDFTDVFSQKSAFLKIIRNCLNNKTITNHETEILSSQKQLIPVSMSSTVLIDSHRKKIGGLISFSDMTEVRELQNKLRQADKVRALSTLAAGMAHEIKNPLSSMKVFSQLLPLKYGNTEFREKFLQVVPQEINRIDRIVESMLGFARSTAPKFEGVNLEKMIEENLRYFEDQAKENKVEIIKQFAFKGDLEIDADANQLGQVFSNLLLNAIQAMPEGGTLTIRTREGKKIEDVLQTVVIEVKDTGHGIAQDHLQKLFDPFFTTKYAGTGLGLTITHSIVDGHRGFIDASSEVGKGTTFVITLPVSQELL
jgi:PAS domain S-box-containing protein